MARPAAKDVLFDPSIDELALDKEWLKQPKIAALWAKRHADAKRELAEAKRQRDVTIAEVKKQVRANPKKFGLEKLTDDGIKSAVDLSRDVALAESEIIEAQHLVDVIAGALFAIEDRRRALQNLVRLYEFDYFQPTGHMPGAAAIAEGNKSARKARPRQPVEDEE